MHLFLVCWLFTGLLVAFWIVHEPQFFWLCIIQNCLHALAGTLGIPQASLCKWAYPSPAGGRGRSLASLTPRPEHDSRSQPQRPQDCWYFFSPKKYLSTQQRPDASYTKCPLHCWCAQCRARGTVSPLLHPRHRCCSSAWSHLAEPHSWGDRAAVQAWTRWWEGQAESKPDKSPVVLPSIPGGQECLTPGAQKQAFPVTEGGRCDQWDKAAGHLSTFWHCHPILPLKYH